jgi:hypothetical protein
MPADTAPLTRADRARLLERVDEMAGLDRMMRERGTLAGPDQPTPLHRAGRGARETAPDASGPS